MVIPLLFDRCFLLLGGAVPPIGTAPTRDDDQYGMVPQTNKRLCGLD